MPLASEPVLRYALQVTIALSKPEIIITHESDLDGLVAGVLLRRLARALFDTDVRMEAWNYHYWKNRELRERTGWITDLTFESRMDKTGWVIIDHHPVEIQARHATVVLDVNKSASLLCYELCRQNGMESRELDRLVGLTNVGDLFLEDHPDFILASDYANLVKTYGFWNLHTLIDGRIEALLDHRLLEVMEVKRRIENPLGFAWSRNNVQELSPTVGFVDTVVGNNNLIVHQLLEEKATRYPVLVTVFRKANGVIIASFRSKNGEARRVAEKLQGGGHPNASGTTLPKSVRNVQDAISYMRQVLNPRAEGNLNSLEAAFESLKQ
jgi:oligoribonuclease NrnB/cAMP/cGMP phosphodiesterase (DHH superfamily)